MSRIQTFALPLQPSQGTLTRVTDLLRHRGLLGVWVLDYCGRFFFLAHERWVNGGRRPLTCKHCSRRITRGPLRYLPPRGDVIPFHKMGSRT